MPEGRIERFGDKEWIAKFSNAGILDKIGNFSDLMQTRQRPYGDKDPVATDVELDGELCDVYYSEKAQRVIVYKKTEAANPNVS